MVDIKPNQWYTLDQAFETGLEKLLIFDMGESSSVRFLREIFSEPATTFKGSEFVLGLNYVEFHTNLYHFYYPIGDPKSSGYRDWYGRVEFTVFGVNTDDMIGDPSMSRVPYRYKLLLRAPNGMYELESDVDNEEPNNTLVIFVEAKELGTNATGFLALPFNPEKIKS